MSGIIHYTLKNIKIFTKIHVSFHTDFMLNGHFDPDNHVVAKEC